MISTLCVQNIIYIIFLKPIILCNFRVSIVVSIQRVNFANVWDVNLTVMKKMEYRIEWKEEKKAQKSVDPILSTFLETRALHNIDC